MKVRIKDTAARDYCSRFKGTAIPNFRWAEVLRKVEGQVLEVERIFDSGDMNATVSEDVSSCRCIHVDKSMIAEILED